MLIASYVLGFVTCFAGLFIMGRIQKWYAQRPQSSGSGTEEQIRTGENIVTVLNSGTPQVH